MTQVAGALNGTKVKMRVFDTVLDTYHFIAGEISSAPTFTNSPIDITNKYSESNRCFMPNEGLQTIDITIECMFATDAGFQYVRGAGLAKSIEFFQFARGAIESGGEVTEVNAMVTGYSESAPDNDKLSASITLTSSSEFSEGLTFEQLIDSDLQPLLDSNNNPIYVQVP